MTIPPITATIATTRKIPKPVPTLKIPAMASQEVKQILNIKRVNTASAFIFFNI